MGTQQAITLPQLQQTITLPPLQQTITLPQPQQTITLPQLQQTITWDSMDTQVGLVINHTNSSKQLPLLPQLPPPHMFPELASTGRAKVYLAFNFFGSMQKKHQKKCEKIKKKKKKKKKS